jgi:hypothetical protein
MHQISPGITEFEKYLFIAFPKGNLIGAENAIPRLFELTRGIETSQQL